MQIAKFKPFSRSDVPQAPEWMDEVFKKLNGILKEHTTALQGQLALGENQNAEIRVLQVRDGVPQDVTLQTLRGRPVGATLLYWDQPVTAFPVRMVIIDVNKVRVTVDFATDPEVAVNVTIVFWGS